MASAEKLLHEAQYAFNSISFGDSRQNTRNASRATSLSRKIIRKYPVSMEAGEAHAILRRLGEEAYTSKIQKQHRHIAQQEHHRKREDALQMPIASGSEDLPFDWSGLLALLFTRSKTLLGLFAFVGFVLFSVFGPFIFVPLVLFALFIGPLRRSLNAAQRERLNQLIAQANIFIAEKRAGSAS